MMQQLRKMVAGCGADIIMSYKPNCLTTLTGGGHGPQTGKSAIKE